MASLHLVDEFVDDRVELDLHALALGELTALALDLDVEAEHDGVGGAGQQDVGLVDRAGGGVDELSFDLVGLDVAERLADRLHRTLHVAP